MLVRPTAFDNVTCWLDLLPWTTLADIKSNSPVHYSMRRILINLTNSANATEVAATLDRRPQVNAVIHEVAGQVAGVNGQLVAVSWDDDTHGQLGASDLQHSYTIFERNIMCCTKK